MAHPYQHIRGDKVSSRRASTLTKAYATGGAVHSDAAQDRKLIRKEVGQMMAEGDMARPRRASGGRVGKKPTTVVNVITQAPQQPQQPPMPMMPPLPPPAGAMPPPPPGPPPGGPPMGIAGPPPGGPGPMPMRKSGGRVKSFTAYPKMKAGAGSGEGRMEKAEKY